MSKFIPLYLIGGLIALSWAALPGHGPWDHWDLATFQLVNGWLGESARWADLVANLSGRIVADATRREAVAIVTACPMCQSNLDMRRPKINRKLQTEHPIPVLYVTQALGLAMGIDPQRLGLQRHMVPVELPEPEPEVVTTDDDDED